MSWPFSPRECPGCRYFQELDSPEIGDDGYEVVGFCGHPRIFMDLYSSARGDPASVEECPFFVPRPKRAGANRSRG
jgi:hypothetical protein